MLHGASGPRKAMLACLCEQLVIAREQAEADGQANLYADTLRLLAGADDPTVRPQGDGGGT